MQEQQKTPAVERQESGEQSHRPTGTPRQYVVAVDAYARRSKEEHLYSGTHYRQLAQFLHERPRFTRSPSSRFPHIVVHHITCNGTKKTDFDGATGCTSYRSMPHSKASQIVFIRGYSSPEWLSVLGAQHRIDPEFFRRHLDFLEVKNYYDLPALPSSSHNFFQLRSTSICTRGVPLSIQQLYQDRRCERDGVERHQRQLSLQGSCGDSIIRQLSTHSRTLYTLEQNISCFLKRHNDGSWVAIIWMDGGKRLHQNSAGLCPSSNVPSQNLAASITIPDACHPVVRHHSKVMSQNSEPQQNSGCPKMSPGNSFEQSVNLLPIQYGTSMDPSIMKLDPLYALSELFAIVACSERQFLNMMRELIVENISNFSEQPELSFANLTHSKAVLDEHVQHTSNTIACLRRRGGSKWPRATDTPAADIVEEALQDLLEDFEQLREHAQGLSARCVEGTDIIMNTATLQESRKAIRQAESLNGLTKLAGLFIPTSFVCSFFGMNVVEFGQGHMSVWITTMVLIPVMMISAVLCSSTISDALKQPFKKRFRKKCG